jgi:hypothetical protein
MTKCRPLTEEKWLASRAPYELLHYLQQHRRITKVAGGRRRLRLFCVACCRSVWDALDERSRQVIEVSERFADGQARKTELAVASEGAVQAERVAGQTLQEAIRAGDDPPRAEFRLWESSTVAARWTVGMSVSIQVVDIVHMAAQNIRYLLVAEGVTSPQAAAAQQREGSLQADLVRCIFGNPFRPVAADMAWLAWNGGTMPRLARAIYDGRAFGRLPVLADALEEAGCAERAFLEHCRSLGPHARGCWVVDALLGKASATCAPPDARAVSRDDGPDSPTPADGTPRLRLYRPE